MHTTPAGTPSPGGAASAGLVPPNCPVSVRKALARVGGAPHLVAFDLDDTLAPSKSPLPAPVVGALVRLLEHTQVCVISGARMEQFETQVLSRLEGEFADQAQRSRLHLLPTCGTRYHRWAAGEWELVWAHDLSADERSAAARTLEEEARRLGLWEAETWGPVLEDRGSQLTFSALGQRAPVDAKKAWDPTGEKRATLRRAVAARLPHLDARSGGSTSIDVTRLGIDKAYGLAALAEATGIGVDRMIFVGDRLDPDGNDHPVLRLGLAAVPVEDWSETPAVIEEILAAFTRRSGGK